MADATALSSITLTFNDGSSTVTYSATNPANALSSTFSNGLSTIYHLDSSVWIQTIADYFSVDNTSTYYFFDMNSRSTIGITQYSTPTNSLYMLVVSA